jgi:hypothetical protein
MTTALGIRIRVGVFRCLTIGLSALLLGLLLASCSERPRAGSEAAGASESAAEPEPADSTQKDYSSTNRVSAQLGEEGPQDGVIHLAGEPDGRTTVETLNGATCRYLNRKPKGNGYLYFAIDPSFKHAGLETARIEFEVSAPETTHVRLQYDGMDGERPKPYRSMPAIDGELITFGPRVLFTRVQPGTNWQTVTFLTTNAVFLNSQNGGADFRLEINPPELYVRRVTVVRVAP